jgi:hypothetical protein
LFLLQKLNFHHPPSSPCFVVALLISNFAKYVP